MQNTTTVIRIANDRQLLIPPEIQQQLNPGDEYLLWITEDSILLKKIETPLSYSRLLKRIEELNSNADTPVMNLEEISQVVREFRKEANSNESLARY